MAKTGGICGKPTPDGGICHNHLSEWGTTLEGLIYTLCLQGKLGSSDLSGHWVRGEMVGGLQNRG